MLKKKTIKQLRELQHDLLRSPQLYNQNKWIEKLPDICGTLGCLGGLVCLKAGAKPVWDKFEPDACFYIKPPKTGRNFKPVPVSKFAAKILGLDDQQRARLFAAKSVGGVDLSGWPVGLWNEYCAASTAFDGAIVAIRRIEVFIQSGGDI